MPRLLIASTVAITLEQFLLPVARHLRSCGWVVDGFATGAGASATCQETFDHVYEAGWSRAPGDLRNYTTRTRTLRAVVSEGGYDVVHLHTPIAGFAGRLGLRRLRRKLGIDVVYTAHGFHFHPNGRPLANVVFRAAERLAAHWTDDLVVINRADHEAALRFPALAPGRVHRTRGVGVDVEAWSADAVSADAIAAVRRDLGLEDGARFFNITARLERVKQCDVAIRAIGLLGRGDVHLVIVGDGPLRGRLEALTAQLGLSAVVHFVGHRSDVPVFMRGSVATLCTSSREGLPRTVLESISLGVPVIGSAIRGVSDLLGDEECGLFATAGAPAEVAAAMARLLDDPDLARRLGERGVVRAREHDVRDVVAFHEALYGRLVAV